MPALTILFSGMMCLFALRYGVAQLERADATMGMIKSQLLKEVDLRACGAEVAFRANLNAARQLFYQEHPSQIRVIDEQIEMLLAHYSSQGAGTHSAESRHDCAEHMSIGTVGVHHQHSPDIDTRTPNFVPTVRLDLAP